MWLAGVTGEERPQVRARVVVAAADHGVAAEGVSAYPPEVTAQMLATFTSGRGAVSVLAREVGAELVCVDAGVRRAAGTTRPALHEPAPASAGGSPGAASAAADRPALHDPAGSFPGVIVRTGLTPSGNLAHEPALTPEAVETALRVGRELVAKASRDGITVLVGGEMGIANTTPATALTAWLTGRPAAELAGPGTGLDAGGVARKAALVERALALHAPATALDALRCVGGGEIAVLTGLALGAAEHGIGLVCDGMIATAATAVAVALEPGVAPWLLAGHRSPEPAHAVLLDHLGLEPVLDLGMRLGEASGATAALAILRLAAATHSGMATFAEAGVAGAAEAARAAAAADAAGAGVPPG